jgi:hypothetical protein
MRGLFSKTAAGVAFVAASLAFSAPASASPVSDVVNWYNYDGSLFQSITLKEDGSFVVVQPGHGTFSSPGFGSESVVVGTCNGCNDVSIGLLEPGSTPAHPIIGDLFSSLTTDLGGVLNQVFTFTSVEDGQSIPIPADPLLQPGNTYSVIWLPETNGPIQIGPYITDGMNMTIQSDVPEPSTLALLASVLIGAAGFIAMRRHRAVRTA